MFILNNFRLTRRCGALAGLEGIARHRNSETHCRNMRHYIMVFNSYLEVFCSRASFITKRESHSMGRG
jgi:hypothetical protein